MVEEQSHVDQLLVLHLVDPRGGAIDLDAAALADTVLHHVRDGVSLTYRLNREQVLVEGLPGLVPGLHPLGKAVEAVEGA